VSNRKKSVTLRWKREPRESGLRGVAQGPRGWHLYWGPNRIASVAVLFKGFSRERDGWYFYASDDNLKVPYRNTCGERGIPAAQVRDSCVAYVLEHLRANHPGYAFKPPTSCPGTERESA
jgi:hypothetical protein